MAVTGAADLAELRARELTLAQGKIGERYSLERSPSSFTPSSALHREMPSERGRRIHMRAIVIDHFGGLDSLVIKEMPEPEPKPKQSTLMQYLTSSATVPSLIPSGCCVGAGAPAWRGGSVVSIRSPTSTRSCKWPAASTFTFFGSFVFGTPGFPLSDVPLQAIADKVAAGRYKAKPSRVFRFEDIREAHRVMEANEAKGKLVVRL
jgi:hypothetical protein